LDQNGKLRILACHSNGEVTLGGTAQVSGSRTDLSLRATKRPGAFGINLDATFDDGEVRVHQALVSLAPHPSRLRPEPEKPSGA
jgi:hypothetical protein